MELFGNAISIVGLQHGSEGKGAVAEYYAWLASIAVRIGASNAGHTVMHDGTPYVMRQIPCGWICPTTKLVLGIAAIISLDVLLAEIETFDAIVPIKHRLFIDSKAHVITNDQIMREAMTGLAERISSTSAKSNLGIGMAMSDKVLRSADCRMAQDVPELQPYMCDTVGLLNKDLADGEIVIFEGTQGFGLSLEHGHFPFVTSRDTTAMAMFAGCGVNPYQHPCKTDIIGVMRAYPIRVGGPSGMFDEGSVELDWEEVARRSGTTRDITEKTSVTKSIRRVATVSWSGIKKACLVNGVTEIALTFADHIDASVYEREVLTDKVNEFIAKIEFETGLPVTLVKTGPHTTIDLNIDRARMMYKIA